MNSHAGTKPMCHPPRMSSTVTGTSANHVTQGCQTSSYRISYRSNSGIIKERTKAKTCKITHTHTQGHTHPRNASLTIAEEGQKNSSFRRGSQSHPSFDLSASRVAPASKLCPSYSSTAFSQHYASSHSVSVSGQNSTLAGLLGRCMQSFPGISQGQDRAVRALLRGTH